MSRTATNIHKERLFRRPAFGFLFKRVKAKAFGLGPPLCFHKEIEASTCRWIAMNEVECDLVGFVAPLENAVCETGRVLIACLRKIARHFLKCWVASVKVELDSGLYLGFCEIGCVFIWSIRVFANFFYRSQCRQISQKTIYTNIRIPAPLNSGCRKFQYLPRSRGSTESFAAKSWRLEGALLSRIVLRRFKLSAIRTTAN